MTRPTRDSRHDGFTLIEILVVIAIIVILMGLLFPVFRGARERARQAKCMSNLRQLATALQMYKQDNMRYPGPPTVVGGVCMGAFADVVTAGYVDKTDILYCPDHVDAIANLKGCKTVGYSSYSFLADITGSGVSIKTYASGGAPMNLYNYAGYNADGFDVGGPSAPGSVWGPGQKDWPRLVNRYAPQSTIVAHCPYHRSHYAKGGLDVPDAHAAGKQHEMVLHLGGDVDTATLSDLITPGANNHTEFETQGVGAP